MNMPAVHNAELYRDPVVIQSIEALNSVGLNGILNNQQIEVVNEMPLAVAWPTNRSFEPFDQFENGGTLRFMGFANGLRLKEGRVMASLVAEVTGGPVVLVPNPNRDMRGKHDISSTRGWYRMSQAQRHNASIQQLDDHATVAYDALLRLCDRSNYGHLNSLFTSGESMGAATALAAAFVARKASDVKGAALVALPNVEDRSVYLELLLKDLANCMPIQGGLAREAAAGATKLHPLLEAIGIDVNGNHNYKAAPDHEFFLKDIVAIPGDLTLSTFRSNEALARAISQATAEKMLDRLVFAKEPIQVVLGFMQHDPVARYDNFLQLYRSRVTPRHLNTGLFVTSHDHAGCNNPYITAWPIRQLIET